MSRRLRRQHSYGQPPGSHLREDGSYAASAGVVQRAASVEDAGSGVQEGKANARALALGGGLITGCCLAQCHQVN